ncbi:hypothetical protein ABZZ20_30260 [Streptomyces sp. NPDC006430]|uniref:hypothetical protein n=1 Tax=Streptomyces sp. NPDC006430 TaxID=3154299 RepID=UPI0033B303BA
MKPWRASSPAPGVPQAALDPYRFPGMRRFAEDEETSGVDPGAPRLDPLRAARRPAGVPSPADRRRLDLHSCLTVAGVPPLAGDLHAIDVLSTVDETTYAAVIRWITRIH